MLGALQVARYTGEHRRGRGRGKDSELMTTQLSWLSAGRGRASLQPVLGFTGSLQCYCNAKHYSQVFAEFAVCILQGHRGFFVREGEI